MKNNYIKTYKRPRTQRRRREEEIVVIEKRTNHFEPSKLNDHFVLQIKSSERICVHVCVSYRHFIGTNHRKLRTTHIESESEKEQATKSSRSLCYECVRIGVNNGGFI